MTLIAGAAGKGTLLGPRHGLQSRAQTGYKLVTEGALGLRRSGGVGVPDSKRGGVVEGSLGQSVIARFAAGGNLGVADRTVADAIFVAGPPRLVAHRAVPHRGYVQLRNGSLLFDIRVTGLA